MSDEKIDVSGFFPGEQLPDAYVDDVALKVQQEKAELRRIGLQRCMEQGWFRDWLMEYLVSLNTFGQTFAVGPTGFPDPNATFFHAGMKAAGEALWEQFDNLTPELVALMRRDARVPKS